MTLTAEEDPEQSDYLKFRGKCQQMSEAAIAADPTLKLVQGWYYCPIWNREEEHWWTVRPDGSIFDPTARQFPSAGKGIYREYIGIFVCAECGKEYPEAEDNLQGRYHCCSYHCAGRLVGLF